MRDSLGNRIPTIFYHVPYRTLTGRVHHLIGLREDMDAHEPCAEARCVDTMRSQMPAGELRPELRRRFDDFVPELPAPPSSRSSASRVRELCTIDVKAAPGLPIVAGAQALARRLGSEAAPAGFVEILKSRVQAERLTSWAVEVSRDVLAGKVEPQVCDFGCVGEAVGASGALSLQVYFPPPQPDRPDYAVSIRIRCAALGRVRGTAASLLSQHLSAPNAEEHSRTIINM